MTQQIADILKCFEVTEPDPDGRLKDIYELSQKMAEKDTGTLLYNELLKLLETRDAAMRAAK